MVRYGLWGVVREDFRWEERIEPVKLRGEGEEQDKMTPGQGRTRAENHAMEQNGIKAAM